MAWIMNIIQIVLSVTLSVCIYMWFGARIKSPVSSNADTLLFPDLQFLLKRYWALWSIMKRKRAREIRLAKYKNPGFVKCPRPDLENHATLKGEDSCESLSFYAADQKGISIYIKLAHVGYRYSEISMELTLADGTVYVLPDNIDTVISCNTNQGWTVKDLKIEVLEPQKRWRIIYNGMMRNRMYENLEHVRLNCIFIAGSMPVQWPEDWSPEIHANTLAAERWRTPQWLNKIKLIEYEGFDQWGSLFGEITCADSNGIELYLRGLHQNRWGKHEYTQFHETVVFYAVTLQGSMFYFGASRPKNAFAYIQFGHLKQADDRVCTIDWMDFDLNIFSKQQSRIPFDFTINLIADGKKYKMIIKREVYDVTALFSSQPWSWKNEIHNLRIEVNGSPGVGMMQKYSPCDELCETKPQTIKKPYPSLSSCLKSAEHVLFFNDKKCQNQNLVGGKGSSLALLSIIKNEDFDVPQGFCVTTTAFDLQLQTNQDLQNLIDDIENICTGKSKEDLQEFCKRTVSAIQSTDVVKSVAEAISDAVEDLEKQGLDEEVVGRIRYAVRSSAVGEDSEETSAAGQNSTLLGVQGINNIVKCVPMCWSSLFSYQSVEYRRQQGLPIKCSMGVCVQRMVNAETAGVMFTRHPTSGDPSSIVITSNYGLGETVVSAQVEPDTIILRRSNNNELRVESTTVGKKSHKVSINKGKLATIALAESETGKMSLSNEIALSLGKVGLHLESLIGAARDIEWAVVNKKIYLLQSRPITSIHRWTNFEITHELDTGVPNDKDILTFANVGEVLPESLTPLTNSTISKVFNSVIGWDRVKNPYGSFCAVLSMRLVLNYTGTFLGSVGKKISMMNKVLDIAICGHEVVTPEIHKYALERNGRSSLLTQYYELFRMIHDLWQNEYMLKRTYEIRSNCCLNPEEFYSTHTLYEKIDENLELLNEISICHSHTSKVSILYQLIAISILTEGAQDFLPPHLADVATLLGNCGDVISSQIPILIREIARSIRRSGKVTEFSEIDPRIGEEWLKSHCPKAANQLKDFLEEHGHRCINEFELRTKTWSQKPETIISMIQSLMKSSPEGNDINKIPSVEETIALLKTPKKSSTRYLLKKLIPLCRKAVKNREETKANFVYVVYKYKMAYQKLGKLMTIKGYLPDDDLVFFLTHNEIGNLLSTHNSTLVRKALHRRRLHRQLGKLQYPEMNIGIPIPIKTVVDTSNREGCAKIHGTSVCGGSVLARACVITDLSEAKEIQAGDILITGSTDIGWSPYFPLLGGVVTELGGLISHGAVVAREYGLPCIVGANGATKIFKTGDTLLLVGDTGTVQIVNRV